MSAAVLTWRKSAVYTMTATLAGAIAALKAAVDAEVVANPLTAKWAVCDSSVPNGTLVLKTRLATTSRRLMIFGGSAPNTAAADAATLVTTSLYCGVANAPGVDAPQQAYASGVPFTTGSWIPGGIIMTTFTAVDRVEYYENDDGIVICWHKAVMNGASGNIASAFLGGLAVSIDGNTVYDIAGGSSGLWAASMDTGIATTCFIGHGTESTGGNTRNNYLDPFIGVARTHHINPLILNADNTRFRNQPGTTRLFLPYVCCNSDYAYTLIKLRQIGMGLAEVHGAQINDVSGVAAIKLSSRADTADAGPWLLNFAI